MRESTRNALAIGVVGGGIGGLTAALALLQRGFQVRVYEQAAALGEIGAGVQISPNASRVLYGLGLAEKPAATGVRPLAWHQRRWDDGRTLLRTPLAEPLEAAFGFPHYQMHRADLLRALTRAVPADCVQLGHRLTGLTDHGDRVEARFANGVQADVDVLVGADGIHSPVRRLLFGPDSPRFTGCVAYRGLVPAERLRELGLEVTAQVWMGPGRHFVHYFVSGGRLVNFVAIVEQATWTRESWTDRGELADALAASLAGGGTDLAASLRRCEQLRVPRASRIQAMSTTNKTRFHLEDGPDQHARDAEMSAGSTDWSFQAVAWIYAHDAAGA